MIGRFDSVDATPEVNPVQQETQKKDAPSLDSLWNSFKEIFSIKSPASDDGNNTLNLTPSEANDVHENKRFSAEEALDKALNDPNFWADRTDTEDDSDEVRVLCNEIANGVSNDDDVIVHDGIYPEYERMIEAGEYEDEEDLCNGEQLNYEDIYDTRSERYGYEYTQGFKDGWNSVEDEDHDNEAYNKGKSDAEALTSLCGQYLKNPQRYNEASSGFKDGANADFTDLQDNEQFTEKADTTFKSKEYIEAGRDRGKVPVLLPSVLDDGTIVDIPEASGVDDNGKPYTDVSGLLFPNHTFEKNGSQYETDSDGRIVKIDGVYLGDDNGTPYLDDNGGYLPNCTFTLDGITYKTDDNGNVYMADGKLLPNTTYELNGNKYTTDDKGRIISCEATPHRTPENPRDNDAQKRAGGEDRHDNDQGGHIVSRDLGGDSGDGNLVAMDSRINQSDYKRMENAIKDALDKGKDVTTKTEFTYSGDSNRPDKITVTVTIDGRDTVYVFDNNLDGSLIDEVPEDGKEAVQDELDETGGVVSSIKKEYDENGNLISTTVTITYTGEDGANHRTEVVIDHTQGGANQ